jgi:hypothetical protein
MAARCGPMEATYAHECWIFGGEPLSADHVRPLAGQRTEARPDPRAGGVLRETWKTSRYGARW